MNKVFVAVLSLLLCHSAFCADNRYYFSSKTWGHVLTNKCPAGDMRNAAIAKVNELRRDNARLTMAQMAQVFNACGQTSQAQHQDLVRQLAARQKCAKQTYNVNTASASGCSEFCKKKADEIGCTQNGRVLAFKSPERCMCNEPGFWAVCGDEAGKSGGREYCVTDFKSANTGQVQLMQGIGIAQEYARVKHGIDDLQCAKSIRTALNDDYLKCTSLKSNTFFEFQFDDLSETFDDTIQWSVKRAIATIHDISFNITARNGSYRTQCFPSLKQSLAKFGYGAYTRGIECWISDEVIGRDEENPDGIDRLAFYNGIQVHGTPEVVAKLKSYVATKMNPLHTFECDANPRQIRNVNGGVDKDDLLRCRANGQDVYFVFDDLSEAWDLYDTGGRQAMDCIVVGGTYNGRSCMHLSERQCKSLAAQSSACKDCAAARWNAEKGICELPASSFATSIEKGVGIASVVAGAAAAVIVTVATGGTVAIALVSTGGVIASGAEIVIQSKAQSWFERTNSCRVSQCAESILTESMKQMINLSNDFTRAEAAAVESELVRLIELAPDTMFTGGKSAAARKEELQSAGLLDMDAWDGWQALRLVGNLLQIAGGMDAVKSARVIEKSGTGFGRWANVVQARMERLGVVESLADATDKTSTLTDMAYSGSIGNFTGASGGGGEIVGAEALNFTGRLLFK